MLFKNCAFVVTQDSQRRILKNTDVLVEGNSIEKIAKSIRAGAGEQVIDCSGKIVMPGGINIDEGPKRMD